jgi:hypothetical protein
VRGELSFDQLDAYVASLRAAFSGLHLSVARLIYGATGLVFGGSPLNKGSNDSAPPLRFCGRRR